MKEDRSVNVVKLSLALLIAFCIVGGDLFGVVILGDVAGRYITEGTAIEYLLNDCIKIVSVILLLHLNRRGLITKILNPKFNSYDNIVLCHSVVENFISRNFLEKTKLK